MEATCRMRVFLLVCWLWLGSLPLFGGSPEPGPRIPEHPELSARLEALDVWIEERARRLEQPGLAIGIVHDGQLLWSKGYGLADVENGVEATPSTVFRIGSISKAFTAVTVMQLVEAGKLDVSTPVRDLLPWFMPRNPFPDADPMTVEHLLRHRFGLPMDAPGVAWHDYTLPDRASIVSSVPGVELIFPPGVARYYSNFGFWTAGEVVRTVGGEPVEDLVVRTVLEPLGMENTTLAPSAQMARLAVGYGPQISGRRKRWAFTDTHSYAAAGDGASSVEDMSRFMAFLMGRSPANETTILRPETVRWLWPPRPTDDGEEIRIRHGGDGGGFYGGFDVAPARKLGVVVLTNCDDGDPRPYMELALSIVEPGIHAALRGDEVPPTPPELKKYLGLYGRPRARAHVVAVGDELFMLDPESDRPWETRLPLEPLGEHAFRLIEVPPSYGESIRFDITSDGTVRGIQFLNHYKMKVESR